MSTRHAGNHTTSRIVAPTIEVYEQGAGTFLKRWGARRKRPPALLLEWMAADILATPEHVQRATGLPILGAIPVQRKGAKSVPDSRGAAAPSGP